MSIKSITQKLVETGFSVIRQDKSSSALEKQVGESTIRVNMDLLHEDGVYCAVKMGRQVYSAYHGDRFSVHQLVSELAAHADCSVAT